MKHLILIFFMGSMSVFGQVTYEFDTVYLYEGNFQTISKEVQKETRYYFINSLDPTYFLVIGSRDNKADFAVFRDNKKNKIAEFDIKETSFLTLSELQVAKKILKNNPYQNPITYQKIDKEERRLNDSVMAYTYTIHRDKKFKPQIYSLWVKKTGKKIPLGIGFADVYSLYPLGKRAPEGLIINATAAQDSETILRSLSLVEIQAHKLTLRFRE